MKNGYIFPNVDVVSFRLFASLTPPIAFPNLNFSSKPKTDESIFFCFCFFKAKFLYFKYCDETELFSYRLYHNVFHIFMLILLLNS